MFNRNQKHQFKLVILEGLSEDKILEKAKGYCLYFIDKKDRSESELLKKLTRKGYPLEIALEALEILKSKNYINDDRLADAYTRQYIRESKGYRYVFQKLKLKGLPLSENRYNEIFEQFSECTPEVMARKIITRKYPLFKNDPKIRKKAFDALLRRGFNFDTIKKAFSIKVDEE